MPGSFYPGGGYPGLYLLRRDTTVVGTRITLIASVAAYDLVATDDGEAYSMAASRQAVLNLIADAPGHYSLIGSVGTTFDFLASQQHGHD